MAAISLTGTYKHQKNENYDDYLKALSMSVIVELFA